MPEEVVYASQLGRLGIFGHVVEDRLFQGAFGSQINATADNLLGGAWLALKEAPTLLGSRPHMAAVGINIAYVAVYRDLMNPDKHVQGLVVALNPFNPNMSATVGDSVVLNATNFRRDL